MDENELTNRFTYHPPTSEEMKRVYESIRDHALDYAIYLNDVCPDSRELSLAITNLEQAVFWANASLARHVE